MNHDYLKLCLITNLASKSLAHYEKFILSAARGGITSLQIREKNLSLIELKYFALTIQSILKPFKIPIILNDHVELAKEINAEGVHLGQSDMDPRKARDILGPDKIIGLSIESFPQLEIANQLDCIDYIAASAIFPSHSKPNCKTLWGLQGLKQIYATTHHPVVAIGGIHLSNLSQVIQHGATGVAVISAIHDHPDPETISAILLGKINQIARRSCYA